MAANPNSVRNGWPEHRCVPECIFSGTDNLKMDELLSLYAMRLHIISWVDKAVSWKFVDHVWLKGTTKCTSGDIAQIGEPIETWLGFDQIPPSA